MAPIRFTRNERLRCQHLLSERHSRVVLLVPGQPHELQGLNDLIDQDCKEWMYIIPDADAQLIGQLGLKSSVEFGVSWPAVLGLNQDLSINTIHIGNGPGVYGHIDLISYLKKRREEKEGHVTQLIALSRQIIRLFDQELSYLSVKSTHTKRCLSKQIPVEVFHSILAFMDVRAQRKLMQVSSHLHYVVLTFWRSQLASIALNPIQVYLSDLDVRSDTQIKNISIFLQQLTRVLGDVYALVKTESECRSVVRRSFTLCKVSVVFETSLLEERSLLVWACSTESLLDVADNAMQVYQVSRISG